MRLIDADVLKQHIDKLPALPDGNFAGSHSALKALINMQPTARPEERTEERTETHTSDCISRSAVYDRVSRIVSVNHLDPEKMWFTPIGVKALIKEMPPAQPHLITMMQTGIKATDADDPYSCGMRNGMRWCMSLIDGKEPLYENCPSAQPEERTKTHAETHACDCINIQAAIDEISRWQGYLDDDMIRRIQIGLRRLPSAQPERKVGKWTEDNACEFCGFKPWYERDIHTLSYCPNCGADMRGEQYG